MMGWNEKRNLWTKLSKDSPLVKGERGGSKITYCIRIEGEEGKAQVQECVESIFAWNKFVKSFIIRCGIWLEGWWGLDWGLNLYCPRWGWSGMNWGLVEGDESGKIKHESTTVKTGLKGMICSRLNFRN